MMRGAAIDYWTPPQRWDIVPNDVAPLASVTVSEH